MGGFSTIPLLFAAQAAFLLAAARMTGANMAVIFGVCLVFAGWGLVSAAVALTGVYHSDALLALLPGLWLPVAPVALGILVCLIRPVRRELLVIADALPDHWFVAIQALRITAVGTLIKTLQGEFPVHVELAIGLTDIVFGLSAIFLFRLARRGAVQPQTLALWHLVGILIILIPGEIAIQMGLPGPLQVFDEPPTSEVMLDYPMVLAPSLVVPLFLMLNAFGVVAALRRRAPRRSETPNHSGGMTP